MSGINNSILQPKITIIVPIYKVEAYLCQCIDSILKQTYKNTEIILVDDGSPDNCGLICDEYEKNDNRVKAIHKKNGGLSDSRNVGIEAATGEYLSFVDGDDWIEHDMIEVLYDNLIKNNADISCCSYYMAYSNGNYYKGNKNKKTLFNTANQAIESFLLNNIPNISSCAKLYKKSIFDSVRYPINKRSEDIFVIVDILLNSNVTFYDNIPKYYYRQRKNSITKSSKYNKNIFDVVYAYEYIFNKLHEKFPDLIELCRYRLFLAKIEVFRYTIQYKNYKERPECKMLLSYLRKNYKYVLTNRLFSKSMRLKILCLKVNVGLYKYIQLFTECISGGSSFKNKYFD